MFDSDWHLGYSAFYSAFKTGHVQGLLSTDLQVNMVKLFSLEIMGESN